MTILKKLALKKVDLSFPNQLSEILLHNNVQVNFFDVFLVLLRTFIKGIFCGKVKVIMSTKVHDEKVLLKKISELETELKKIKKQKKYGLVWEDKPEQIVEDCKRNVPILRLKEKKKGINPVITTDKTKDENILIEGDNYHALSVLNYTHKGKVDVIYIDPPYNTESGDFKYNDKFVDKEDAFRHSKWISFMEKRLLQAKKLLSRSGIIFISIDDNEHGQLRVLCDGIFTEDNFIGTITWEKRTKAQNTETAKAMFQSKTEYILVYKNDNSKIKFKLENAGEKIYDLEDERGLYRLKVVEEMSATGMRARQTMIFAIEGINPRSGFQWKIGREQIDKFKSRNDIEVISGRVYLKIRPNDESNEKFLPFWSHFFEKDIGTAESGKSELTNILATNKHGFETVKPINLIKKLLFHINKNKEELVLDFFAGSGTTGQAILDLNNKDGGNRKFILCTNNENNICEEIAYNRIKRVINGYKNKKKEKVRGLGGNLRYYKTDLVDIEKLHHTPDQAKVKLTYQAGEMIGLRENTPNESQKNDWWQIFEGHGKTTAIYFKEDKERLQDLVDILEKKNQPAVLYIFSWGKNEYKSEYSTVNIRVEDIPEPILEVYKEINRL